MARVTVLGAMVLGAGVLSTGVASADVTIVETMTITAGGKPLQGTRTTYISGAQMRIDAELPGQVTATIFDLPAGSIINLDAKTKRAESRDIAVRATEVEKEYPRARVETSLGPGGSSREVAGVSCDEHAFTIRVPMTKDGSMALRLTGSACVASHADGAADYDAFATIAREHDVVLGPASSNKILLARTRAQTELYRAIAAAGGIPFAIDMTFSVDGGGVLSSMVRKVIAGTQSVAVTRVTAGPIPASTFTVPDGWKRARR
jgi:hypothetical protein